MKYRKTFIIVIFVLLNSNSFCQDSQQSTNSNDSLYTAILINHLRNNFDDIHDVSMRFHHKDYRLNGMIVLGLHWEDGILTSYSVERNDTNDEQFPVELAKNIEKWHIKEIEGIFDINLPLNIQIIGNTDSTFTEKCIFTGEIIDEIGNPIKNVKVSLTSTDSDEKLRSTYSNREGIFVKTLIPLGKWNVRFAADGYESITLENMNFDKVEHVRKKIVMNKS